MKLPCSYREVTLKQFADIQETIKSDFNEVRKNNLILSALTETPLHEIEALPFAKTVDMINKCDWLTNLPNKLIDRFEIDGVRYKLQTDIGRASAAQYADLTEFCKRDGWFKYAECAAVLCLPEGDKGYDSSKVEERAELFWDKLTVDIIYPMCSFFLLLLEEWLRITQYSTNQKLLKMREKMLETLEETINS
jgi:hypothetical protein